MAREAFCTAYGALPASYAGRKEVRLKVHMAATMAGMAFTQAGLGLCHAMAHSLGGMFHVSHGRLNAILLPAIIDINNAGANHRYADLAKRLGFGTGADSMALRNLKNALIRLRKGLDLPENLQQAGIDPVILKANMDHLIEAALNDACCNTNPVKVEASMVRKVLEAVMGHG